MRFIVFAGCVLLGMGVAGAATDASFDCAKAKSRSETLICRTPKLSALDDELMQTYRADLAVSPTPVNLTLGQRQWIADRDKGEPADSEAKTYRPLTADEMEGDYRDRITALKTEIALTAKTRAMSFPLADLGKRCAPVSDDLAAKCAVSESGRVKGPDGFGPLYYQLQGPPDGSTEDFTRGVVVFEARSDNELVPLVWSFLEGGWFETPKFLSSPDGPLLWLPGNDDGTGAFNEDLLYHRAGDRWRDLDLQTWKTDLAKRLPPDRQVWKGVPYDFTHLRATTGLWRPNDGNCCPTGGHADLTFKIVGDKLEIATVARSEKNIE